MLIKCNYTAFRSFFMRNCKVYFMINTAVTVRLHLVGELWVSIKRSLIGSDRWWYTASDFSSFILLFLQIYTTILKIKIYEKFYVWSTRPMIDGLKNDFQSSHIILVTYNKCCSDSFLRRRMFSSGWAWISSK